MERNYMIRVEAESSSAALDQIEKLITLKVHRGNGGTCAKGGNDVRSTAVSVASLAVAWTNVG